MKRLFLSVLVASAIFLALSALCLRTYLPPLSDPLTVDLFLERGSAGHSEPLIVAGRPVAGDFLFIQHVAESQIVFGYNSWGFPGHVSSTPVAIAPGRPLRLQIEMPALTQMRGRFADPPGLIRVKFEDQVVFEHTDHYFMRQPREIYLAQNPLGGSACGPELRGRIQSVDGRELRGDPTQFLTFKDRLSGWLSHSRQVYAILLVAFAVAIVSIRVFPSPRLVSSALVAAARHVRTTHGCFLDTGAVCAVVFAWMITQGTFDFDVTEPLGSFYDYQAASLLDGRLDVTEEAIGGEAFVFEGKLYGYFGPTPALLRLPLVFFDFGFGNLSRAFMLGYFIATLVAAYLLLRQVAPLLGRTSPPSDLAVIFLTLNVGLGSTVFFLGSRAYVYHEAILCGVAFALFACHFALRHWSSPAGRWWLPALWCALLSLHARPPTGLFALTLLGCVALVHLWRQFTSRVSHGVRVRSCLRPIGVGLLCVVGVTTFNGLSYLKFKTFDGAPLRLSRPYGPERLAHIDGKSFHAANVTYGFYTYFVRPNFQLEGKFPWIYLGSPEPGFEFPHAKLDLPDHTLAVTYAMPGLCLLAALAAAAAITQPAVRPLVQIACAAIIPMSVALFAAIATAQRYTADWVPFLVCAATFGLAWVDSAKPILRYVLQALLATATLGAVMLTLAFTLHYQRETVWGVPEELRQSYQSARPFFDDLFPRAP